MGHQHRRQVRVSLPRHLLPTDPIHHQQYQRCKRSNAQQGNDGCNILHEESNGYDEEIGGNDDESGAGVGEAGIEQVVVQVGAVGFEGRYTFGGAEYEDAYAIVNREVKYG